MGIQLKATSHAPGRALAWHVSGAGPMSPGMGQREHGYLRHFDHRDRRCGRTAPRRGPAGSQGKAVENAGPDVVERPHLVGVGHPGPLPISASVGWGESPVGLGTTATVQ